MLKFEDLKVGMEVKMYNLEQVVTIKKIDERDKSFRICEGTGWFSVDWIEYIVKPEQNEKVGKMLKFEDLKVGDRVKLKSVEECKGTNLLTPMRDVFSQQQYAEKVVTISKMIHGNNFLIEEDNSIRTFSMNWIDHIVQPENLKNVEICEEFQNAKKFEKQSKERFEKLDSELCKLLEIQRENEEKIKEITEKRTKELERLQAYKMIVETFEE